ncbi:hypothetical protein BDP55DRAFT_654416 [Colletotrichum godetiae]|uniref:Uncharacterized protein n=1 Tax=Colletotrichum godetiae TaxID=1209918 RepID=A0AAJ0EVU3_9PEZI|nr:uncharacterized protein BDP55DRAFT_654416 [Colletotrichum godetiae]KAK1689154.1 hypothetical protein BDP55DRAFT_654416 [Colletotrichum godetiae]
MDNRLGAQSVSDKQPSASKSDTHLPRNGTWQSGTSGTSGTSSRRNGYSSPVSFSGTEATILGSFESFAPLAARSQLSEKVPIRPSSPATLVPGESAEQQDGQVTGTNETEKLISPSQEDFEMDPGHAFWSWSVKNENWYHVDKHTGSVLWAPRELD